MGTTKAAVSPMMVAGARFRIAKPPSRMSDTVIGASRGRPGRRSATGCAAPCGARRRRRAAIGRGDVGSGPVHDPVLLGRRGTEGGRAATLGRWRATRRARTATASPTSTTTGTATVTDVAACTERLAALVDEVGGGPVLELGIGSGRLALPLADARRRGPRHRCLAGDARAAPRQAGQRGAHPHRGRHGRPRPGRPAAVRRRVRGLQHLLQPRLGG